MKHWIDKQQQSWLTSKGHRRFRKDLLAIPTGRGGFVKVNMVVGLTDFNELVKMSRTITSFITNPMSIKVYEQANKIWA